jgi:hypothetical protein
VSRWSRWGIVFLNGDGDIEPNEPLGGGGRRRLNPPEPIREGDFYAAGDDSYVEPNWEKFPLTFNNAYEREKRKSYGVEEMK